MYNYIYILIVDIGLVYVPTIVSACVFKTDDAAAKLNVQWKVLTNNLHMYTI